jgi:hypothetical protein
VFGDFDCVHVPIIPAMKLVRPDVFHPRIVLAGCPRLVSGDPDDAGLVAALRGRGLHARWMSWDDADALDAHVVILRATRDYAERLDEFLAWTKRAPKLLNGAEAVGWNADERYLLDLKRRGVPVVKPTDTRAEQTGETALVLIAGQASHAFVGSTPVEPDFEIWDVGFAALAAAGDKLNANTRDFLYARADVIGGVDDPRLVKLDLIAPSLGWLHLDGKTRELRQREFARAVASALERLGLGPLSHRRP